MESLNASNTFYRKMYRFSLIFFSFFTFVTSQNVILQQLRHADTTISRICQWTDANTADLIVWRVSNNGLFTGRRNAAIKAFELYVKEKQLVGKVTPAWVRKKWENLKQKYKDLKSLSMVGGDISIATWKWYVIMDGALSSETPLSHFITSVQVSSSVQDAPPIKQRKKEDWLTSVREMERRQEERKRQTSERADERDRRAAARKEERDRRAAEREAERDRRAAEREDVRKRQVLERREREMFAIQERWEKEMLAREERQERDYREREERRERKAAAREERQERDYREREERRERKAAAREGFLRSLRH